MRKRKVIVIVALVLLGAGLAVLLLTRDSGPAVEVYGNFTAKDVAEIKGAVRRQLWREALPNFSKQSVMAFPRMAKRALTTHVGHIGMWGSPAAGGKGEAYATFSGQPESGYILTNESGGWRWAEPYIYIVPD